MEDCSAIVADVTAEEICEFVQEKSNIVAASSTIKNPIGFPLATECRNCMKVVDIANLRAMAQLSCKEPGIRTVSPESGLPSRSSITSV